MNCTLFLNFILLAADYTYSYDQYKERSWDIASALDVPTISYLNYKRAYNRMLRTRQWLIIFIHKNQLEYGDQENALRCIRKCFR